MLRSVVEADPVDALLAQYVAGRLAEPLSLMVQAHVALSDVNHAWIRDLDAMSGERLATAKPLAVDDRDGTLGAILRLPQTQTEMTAAAATDPIFPAVLRAYCGFGSDRIPWHRRSSAYSECRIGRDHGYSVDLIKIGPGRQMPAHTHGGIELTLVLDGQFADDNGVYQRGDLVFADETTVHRPISAVAVGCLCVAVTETAPILTGRIARIANPYLRWSYERNPAGAKPH